MAWAFAKQYSFVLNLIPSGEVIATIISVVSFATLLVKGYRFAESCSVEVAAEIKATAHYTVVPDHVMSNATVEKFLWEMAYEKPIRFMPQQLAGFTRNYSARLGALPNGLTVAVKVGTIGRTHHINLVRLFGFYFDAAVRALVYEYMGNGALDAYLFDRSRAVADFGLAQLLNRADTHVPVSGVRGTPGYAAPETWMQSGVTEKCDVHSFARHATP
ncbi:hypothetical protein E2562_007384 [Oryza meyeriana var. granulata]|uniref:Serine-threonine/tyrosine-protein kinase catalytic domain-containing protein n=1 Tax=Oryza meyeriana var. granulata TaxID=110450 RepID=A0A6G1CZJ6_9ORYZ|nr:hypothetical protein E2562_007384 [Oryza meyeriana var. granulata]